MTSLLLRPTEAAEQLGIGRTKVYELMRPEALAYVKIGVLRRIPYAAARTVHRRARDHAREREP